MPFSDRWFYGDALYIVDPVMYAALGGAIVAARASRRRGPDAAMRAARVGVALAAFYIGIMLVSNWWARAEVRGGLERAGLREDTRFMVSPVLGNPLRRDVVIDTGERYEKGALWFEPAPHFRPLGYGVDKNADAVEARAARQTPLFAAYLRWSRFPFYVVERTAAGTRVYLNDYRYSGPGAREGWAGVVTDVSSHVQ
jgi:inner membrane protein